MFAVNRERPSYKRLRLNICMVLSGFYRLSVHPAIRHDRGYNRT